MDRLKYTLRDWAVRHAEGPGAKRWLAFFSFAEASFFPIPPDVLLISILATQERKEWKQYALIATIFSVLGGVFGYLVGWLLYDSVGVLIVELYNLEEYMVTVKEIFSENAFVTMFLAGFTLIPYKIFTISAGFFEISLLAFLAASILSRAARFFVVSYIMYVFGEELGKFAFRYFNILTMILAAVIVAAAFFIYIQ